MDVPIKFFVLRTNITNENKTIVLKFPIVFNYVEELIDVNILCCIGFEENVRRRVLYTLKPNVPLPTVFEGKVKQYIYTGVDFPTYEGLQKRITLRLAENLSFANKVKKPVNTDAPMDIEIKRLITNEPLDTGKSTNEPLGEFFADMTQKVTLDGITTVGELRPVGTEEDDRQEESKSYQLWEPEVKFRRKSLESDGEPVVMAKYIGYHQLYFDKDTAVWEDPADLTKLKPKGPQPESKKVKFLTMEEMLEIVKRGGKIPEALHR